MNPELQQQINEHIARTVESVHESYRDVIANFGRQLSEANLNDKFVKDQIKALEGQIKDLTEERDKLLQENNELRAVQPDEIVRAEVSE